MSSEAVSGYKFSLLEPQDIVDHWDKIEPLLETAVDHMWDHDMQTLQAALIDPNVRLYLIATLKGGEIKGVTGVEFLEGANGVRAVNFAFFSGAQWRTWMPEGMPKVIALARQHGCTMAMGAFRRGIKRMFPEWDWTHEVGKLEL
jgi:hypothetical protein